MPPSPPPTLLPMAWHGDTMGQTRNRPKCTTITEALTKTASCTLYMYRAKKVKGTTKKLMAQFPPPHFEIRSDATGWLRVIGRSH